MIANLIHTNTYPWEKKEPENLLILTRTTTDRHGRRHSVAVPLIPPPDGEKFEGGYSVERNPITGGAKLVPPTGGKPPLSFFFLNLIRTNELPTYYVSGFLN